MKRRLDRLEGFRATPSDPPPSERLSFQRKRKLQTSQEHRRASTFDEDGVPTLSAFQKFVCPCRRGPCSTPDVCRYTNCGAHCPCAEVVTDAYNKRKKGELAETASFVTPSLRPLCCKRCCLGRCRSMQRVWLTGLEPAIRCMSPVSSC